MLYKFIALGVVILFCVYIHKGDNWLHNDALLEIAQLPLMCLKQENDEQIFHTHLCQCAKWVNFLTIKDGLHLQ